MKNVGKKAEEQRVGSESQPVDSESVDELFAGENREEEVGAGGASGVIYRSGLHFSVVKLVNHPLFTTVIMCAIFANSIMIVVEFSSEEEVPNSIFDALNTLFITIYTMEFALKLFAQPIKYWKSGYNILDFLLLLVSYFSVIQDLFASDLEDGAANVTFLRVFRALRALRALRSISFIRGLQVIVSALLKTIASSVNVVVLLILVMFVFSMIGHYFFGRDEESDNVRWGTIFDSMYSLWVYTTLDGWVILQQELDKVSTSTRLFSIFFIFIGNFIIKQLFIGVVIQNLEEAQQEERNQQESRRLQQFELKKNTFLRKQERDLQAFFENLRNAEMDNHMNMQDFMASLVGTLRHDDIVPMQGVFCNQLWLRAFVETLQCQSVSLKAAQKLHYETLTALCTLAEQRLQAFKDRTVPVAV